MREATGELNMTYVVVTLVAALVAFFYFVIWPMIDTGQKQEAGCNNAICPKTDDGDGWVECTPKGDSGKTITCKYKG